MLLGLAVLFFVLSFIVFVFAYAANSACAKSVASPSADAISSSKRLAGWRSDD
jgi:hypothetical protein